MNGYLTLIDLVVVTGAAVVLPLALGRWAEAWVVVAGCTALAFSVDPGTAGLLWALPWPVLAAAATVVAVRDACVRPSFGRQPHHAAWSRPRFGPGGLGLDAVAAVAAPAFALVAGIALVVSCGDLGGFPYGEPITRLTAVHFTFAGAATTALGRAALAVAPSHRRRRAATGGLVLALAAPPVVGLGFTTEAAIAQVGGAVLMTLSVYLIAGCHLAEAWPARRTRVGRLLAVSGLSVWLPMVLAVTWALGQNTGGPAPSIPDMTRIHGSLNAFGFVGCGLAARWLATRPDAAATIAPSPTADGLGASTAPATSAVPA